MILMVFHFTEGVNFGGCAWSDLNAAVCIPAAPFAGEPSSLPVSVALCGTSVSLSEAAAAAAQAGQHRNTLIINASCFYFLHVTLALAFEVFQFLMIFVYNISSKKLVLW